MRSKRDGGEGTFEVNVEGNMNRHEEWDKSIDGHGCVRRGKKKGITFLGIA